MPKMAKQQHFCAAIKKSHHRKKNKVYFSEVNATMSTYSVNRVRRRLWGEERKKKKDEEKY
jgi:hypothetical protein